MLPITLPRTIPLPTTVVLIPPQLYDFADSTAALWRCRLHCRRRFHCRRTCRFHRRFVMFPIPLVHCILLHYITSHYITFHRIILKFNNTAITSLSHTKPSAAASERVAPSCTAPLAIATVSRRGDTAVSTGAPSAPPSSFGATNGGRGGSRRAAAVVRWESDRESATRAALKRSVRFGGTFGRWVLARHDGAIDRSPSATRCRALALTNRDGPRACSLGARYGGPRVDPTAEPNDWARMENDKQQNHGCDIAQPTSRL